MEKIELAEDGKSLKITTTIPERKEERIVPPKLIQERRANIQAQIDALNAELVLIDRRLAKAEELGVITPVVETPPISVIPE